jgi:Protein of unknown function (DUF2946)
MGLRRLKRSAFAGWLAVLALSIQALIPALLAAEISVADTGSGGLFTLCAFGHLHAANHHHEEGSGSSHDSDGDEANAVCPICLALLASPAFTATPAVFLPPPAARPVEVIATADTAVAVARFFEAYRSRAPPLG